MNVDRNRPSPNDPRVSFYAHSARMDERMLDSILAENRELRELHLEHCNFISSDWFVDADFPSSLRYIDVSCTAISDVGVLNIFARCKQLVCFHLVACKRITEVVFSIAMFPRTLQAMCLNETNFNPSNVYKRIADNNFLSKK